MPNNDAVLLVGFGAPEKQADVPDFIRGILAGRKIPESRVAEVAHHYETIGGGSPYNRCTLALEKALAARLAADPETAGMRVYTGMRQWHPYLADVARNMKDDGVRSARAIVLAPHRCEASWERYLGAVRSACEPLGADAPSISFNAPWHGDPLFAEAVSDRAEAALARLPSEIHAKTELIFTAHSIPVAMQGAGAYADEFRASAAAAAARLGHPHFQLAYQSRSGAPGDAWLTPSIEEALEKSAASGAKAAVVVPVGFLCDHVEVLFDLDVEAAARAKALGLGLARAGTVGDHPAFVSLLARLATA